VTPLELRVVLKQLNLPQRQLAIRLGLQVSTVQRWVSGDRPVAKYAVAYLELLQQLQGVTRDSVLTGACDTK